MENSASTTLTVYGKPACVQCAATERYLKSKGIPFEKVDISVDEVARERVAAMGYQQVPVVVTATGHHWYGYNPDELALLS